MNTLHKITLILFLLSISMFYGCKKSDRSTNKDVAARIDSTGVCGFLVKINASSTNYVAVNLPDLYQRDSLKIIISYHILNSTHPCIVSNPYPEIYIDAIHKE